MGEDPIFKHEGQPGESNCSTSTESTESESSNTKQIPGSVSLENRSSIMWYVCQVFNWIFGISFLLLGLGFLANYLSGNYYIFYEKIRGPGFIAVAFLLLPPVRDRIFSKTKIRVPWYVRALLIIYIFSSLSIPPWYERRMECYDAASVCDELEPSYYDMKSSHYNMKDLNTAAERCSAALSKCNLVKEKYKIIEKVVSNKERISRLTYKLGNIMHIYQDFAKAKDLYLEAASAGHFEAMRNYASMYEHGEGVTMDKTEALDWYRKSLKAAKAAGNSTVISDAKDGIDRILEQRKAAAQQAAAAPAQTAASSEAFVLSPPLDPKMAALLAHARENFKACRLKEALEETELVLAQTHAGAPEAIAQTNEFVDFTQVITTLINEAVELHNNGNYDSSVSKIQEAVDKCPTYPVAVETQQKIKISASNYYKNQRVEERNRQIEAENQRVAEENARQQQSSSSSDYDDSDCDEDGCW